MKSMRQWTGPLTEELVLKPGEFGLGQVPARLKPDAAVKTICGFCSTGCGLKVHLRAGEAINLSPEVTYPVNLGMACPKGWEALTPLRAPDRATTRPQRDGSHNATALLNPSRRVTLTCRERERGGSTRLRRPDGRRSRYPARAFARGVSDVQKSVSTATARTSSARRCRAY